MYCKFKRDKRFYVRGDGYLCKKKKFPYTGMLVCSSGDLKNLGQYFEVFIQKNRCQKDGHMMCVLHIPLAMVK